MKTELWNGHPIRFVQKDNEWWAVAQDVAIALDYAKPSEMTRMIELQDKGVHKVHTTSEKAKCPKTQDMIVITEFGIYAAVFGSHKPEAKAFKRWVFDVIKQLREASGLEGFEIFRTLDKEHQRKQMAVLAGSLKAPVRVDFIKANTIANKAVSTRHGHPKMIKKGDMSPEMLAEREAILEDTVNLMVLNDRYGLCLSVSDSIYNPRAIPA